MIAVIDTNCDPDMVDHKIPGNDDAIRAIRLFCSSMADAVIDGKGLYDQSLTKEKGEERATAVAAPTEMDQPMEQSALGGV